jgi:hypothetical protein
VHAHKENDERNAYGWIQRTRIQHVLTGAIGVEEIKGFFDFFPLLRRQTLAAAPFFPVATGHASGSLLASVIARLHGSKTQSSARHVEALPILVHNHHHRIFKGGNIICFHKIYSNHYPGKVIQQGNKNAETELEKQQQFIDNPM